MAAILTNVTYTYTDPRYGALTIQPGANGDSVVYVRRGGVASTDNHYFAQSNAIDDTHNPCPALYTALDHHPSNSGPYIAYVASNLVASIQGLTALVQPTYTNLVYGANVTRTMATLDPDDTLKGGPYTNFGDRYIGYVSGLEIVEWTTLPNNYMVVIASGADAVLGMRQYEAPEIQGLFPEYFTPDGNLFETRMLRFCGFGAINRIGAAVQLIGSGSYAIPSGFQAPLVA